MKRRGSRSDVARTGSNGPAHRRRRLLTIAMLLVTTLAAGQVAGQPAALDESSNRLPAASPAPTAPAPTAPAPTAPAPTAPARLEAELRFRASTGSHLRQLQAGQDYLVRGIFERIRLGAHFGGPGISGHVELQSSGAFGDTATTDDGLSQPLPVGLQQGYVHIDIAGIDGLDVELGRMALEYGRGRHVGSYDFHDSGNAFDGLKLHYGVAEFLDIDGVAVQIRRNSAQPDEERTLVGTYLVGRPVDGLRADVYLLYLRDGRVALRAELQTVGLRMEWRPTGWLVLETEAAVQFGDLQPQDYATPQDHLASSAVATVEASGRLGVPLRLGLYGAQHSGDRDAADNQSAAWRPLYPSLDQVVGLLQIFAPSNLRQLGGHFGGDILASLAFDIDVRACASMAGAPLPAFGGPLVPAGDGWRYSGTEVDARLTWRPLPHSELLLAAGAFAPARWLAVEVGSGPSRQFLLQWSSRF